MHDSTNLQQLILKPAVSRSLEFTILYPFSDTRQIFVGFVA